MKHGRSSAARIAHLIERAARCEGKTGEGKVSTEAIASILGPPGEPIFSETGVGGVGARISAISVQSDLHLLKTPDTLIRVEFPAPARACMRVKRRTRAAVENSLTAVQHFSAVSDNDAAQRLNDASAILFKTIFNRSKTAP